MTANPKQQDINGKVVARFVYACMSSEIGDILNRTWTDDPIEGMTWDDVQNYPAKRDWEEVREANPDEWEEFLKDEYPELVQDRFSEDWGKWVDEGDMDGFLDHLDNINMESREIYLCTIELDDEQQAAWLEYAENHNCEVNSDYDEIYEWWIVDRWFGEKLAEQGEAILELSLSTVWGRRTTGQAILLDECITRFQKQWAPWAAWGTEDGITED